MNTKISPLVKGSITGALMLVTGLLLFYTNQSPTTGLQNISYLLYAGGIFWTLFAYSRSQEYTGKFGDLFLQGFRCFIVVTLIMVIYIGIFTKMHPEMAEEYSKIYREELVKKEKNRTPKEVDEIAASAKKGYTTAMVYSSIFGYLLLGTVFTAAGAGVLLLTRRK